MEKIFKFEHKRTGMIKRVAGFDKYDAARKAGLDLKLWKVK